MPDVIEPALSGRAKCRGCGRAISKGELRFGESYPNPYAEGEATSWFHVGCTALMRPEKFIQLLALGPTPLGDAGDLSRIAEVGAAHRRLPRLCGIERASSGRARCRSCRETIDKGAFRLRLQIIENGRVDPIGCIHVDCAEAYFGTADIFERIFMLDPSFEERDREEIRGLLAKPRPAPLAKTEPDGSASSDEDDTRRAG